MYMRENTFGTATSDPEVDTSSHVIQWRITTGLQMPQKGTAQLEVFGKWRRQKCQKSILLKLNIKTYFL